MGTAEIYQQLDQFVEIEDSLAVEHERKNSSEIILFVKMNEEHSLTNKIKKSIFQKIEQNVSRWHVPRKIIEVDDIPYTFNMKKVEVAVKKVIHDQPVVNQDSIMNPESLECFRNLKELKNQ